MGMHFSVPHHFCDTCRKSWSVHREKEHARRCPQRSQKHDEKTQSRIIIVDGVDMTGKTEIAKAIAEKYGYTYFKNDAERREFGTGSDYFINVLRYGLTYFLSFLRQSNVGVVFDRCYPSEFVYAKAFNRDTDWKVMRECDEEMKRLGAVIVMTHRSSYEGISDDTHPHLVDSQKLATMDKLYNEFAEWTTVPVLKLNVDDEDLERELRDVDEFLRSSGRAE